MDTTDPRSVSHQDLVSQDDDGLWMKMDTSSVTDHTAVQSINFGDNTQDVTTVMDPGCAVITRYYSVVDDMGADDVFIPQPLPSSSVLLPAEGSTGVRVNNSTVTHSRGASEAREANANPSSLDCPHDERQLTTAQNKAEEETTGTAPISKESMETISLPSDKDPIPPTGGDQTSDGGTGCLMATCHDPDRHHQDNDSRGKESNEEFQDTVIRKVETDMETDKHLKDITAKFDERVTHFDKDANKTKSKCITDSEPNSKLEKETSEGEKVGTNVPTLPGLCVRDDTVECGGPPGLCNQNKMDLAPNHPVEPNTPTDVSNDDKEHVNSRSLDYNLTNNDAVWKESSSNKTQVTQHHISECCEGTVTEGGHEDGSRKITTEIQQGEKLLQRLQLVQQQQDEHMSMVAEVRGKEKVHFDSEASDLTVREVNLTDGTERSECTIHTVSDEGARLDVLQRENNEKNEGPDDEKARISMFPKPEHSEDQIEHARAEADKTDDDQSDSWVSADWSPINLNETPQMPKLSAHHRFSADEISVVRQIQEAHQGKQNLQRAVGIFNLADNPDVLEIPFKTTLSLEPLPHQVGQSQCSDWQFSQQKMQKEMSQEIQRELVLVNQGTIPGGYGKGDVRQLKETKLLFEAFQQDNTEGPTRHRKLPTTLIRDPIYPSVLERTRSLEMFALQSCPVSREHSLRLYESASSEREKSPESPLRSKSPSGGSCEKTRLSPYPIQDKPPHRHKSMDSISSDVSTPAVEARSKIRQGDMRQGSPILQQNPFFKLRPALALQPEVEKDIRQAKEREEELRRQRCSLYGENRQTSQEETSRFTKTHVPEFRQQSRGKLERVWPPATKKDKLKSETQEAKVQRAGSQRAPLWQRWESGQISSQSAKEKN